MMFLVIKQARTVVSIIVLILLYTDTLRANNNLFIDSLTQSIDSTVISTEIDKSGLSRFISNEPYIFLSFNVKSMDILFPKNGFDNGLKGYVLVIHSKDKYKLYMKLTNFEKYLNMPDTIVGLHPDNNDSKMIKWTFKHMDEIMDLKDDIKYTDDNIKYWWILCIYDSIMLISSPSTNMNFIWDGDSSLPKKYKKIATRLDALMIKLVMDASLKRYELQTKTARRLNGADEWEKMQHRNTSTDA